MDTLDMKKSVFTLLSTLLLTTSILQAEEQNDFAFERFNLYFENDIFDSTDKGYTNGVKFSAIYQVNTEEYTYLTIPFLHDESKNHFVTLAFGQDIYTPEDTNLTVPNPDDQPYAGWLYVSMAFQQADDKESDTLELQLGVVGPAALGEEIQNGIHEKTGSLIANGWDSQLHNEPGVVLAYEHRWRHVTDEMFLGINADAIPFTGFALGNVHTYAHTGAAVRIGWNVPHDFGKAVTRPAQEAGLPAFKKSTERYSPKWAFYFLSALDMSAVARNIFLDGNSDGDSTSVPDREYFVGEFTAGIGIDYGSLHIALMNTHKTKEFPLDSVGYSFGSIAVSYVY